jgi:hypothetical protein
MKINLAQILLISIIQCVVESNDVKSNVLEKLLESDSKNVSLLSRNSTYQDLEYKSLHFLDAEKDKKVNFHLFKIFLFFIN